LQLINPTFIVLIAFVVSAIISIVTGTSWGSVGTVGVALMGIATGLGANLPATAGAIVAGAYFGDKLSPLSDTTTWHQLLQEVNCMNILNICYGQQCQQPLSA